MHLRNLNFLKVVPVYVDRCRLMHPHPYGACVHRASAPQVGARNPTNNQSMLRPCIYVAARHRAPSHAFYPSAPLHPGFDVPVPS